MPYQLIIAEKPQAAFKIASSLADTSADKKAEKGVPYYELTHKNKQIVIASAVGHLFNLAEKTKSQLYPSFEIEWVPSYVLNKNSAFTKKYFDLIKKLSKNANEFVIATDFDNEGSTIGYNCLKFLCKREDAKRMKFSTLTKDELIDSYENAMIHLDFENIDAGITRHFLDWFWGINSSRALTNSIKNSTGRYKLMSTGRVQGPTLKIIVDREKEIKAFKPVPYFQIQLLFLYNKKTLEAMHIKDKFDNKKDAEKVLENTKGKEAFVDKIERTQFSQLPPFPFDLTTLQTESYRVFRIQPSKTLEIAQKLYLAGLISYPRTSSQQLPESINYKKIISLIGKQKQYSELCNNLLTKKLKPNNGKKTDPAHPAIYATGEVKKLEAQEEKIYDLIVRRTLATFADKAIRETTDLTIDINKEKFLTKLTYTLEKGWHIFYGPYAKFTEDIKIDLKKGDKINVKEINLLEKETQPPKRYTPSSIIKKMETLNLGTKATRSQIVETLFDRHYIQDTALEATTLGIKTIETLEKYCPEIVDVKLTEHFENELEQIQERKKKKELVIEEAKTTLNKIFEHFKKNEDKIGKELYDSSLKTQEESNVVGKCNLCDGNLRIMYSKKNRQYFIACSNYPNCKNTFSLTYGIPKKTDRVCDACGFPLVKIIRKGKKPFDYCINKTCKKKEEWIKNNFNSS